MTNESTVSPLRLVLLFSMMCPAVLKHLSLEALEVGIPSIFLAS